MPPAQILKNDPMDAQWHPTKNGGKKLSDFTNFSHYKAWWECDKRHAYIETVKNRVIDDKSCPYCSYKKLLTGFNDLATISPKVATEWHSTKNVLNSPELVLVNTSKNKVAWICSNHHEWEASVTSRVHQKYGCPYCSGRLAISGVNDFATINPLLAAQWHPTKNGDLLPSQFLPKSSIKAWWLGSCGHEWETTIANRTVGKNCPYCVNRLTQKGFNDLATTHPNLLAEWDYKKNVNINPSQFTFGSNKKVWWIGKCNHSWEQSIKQQALSQHCPICLGTKVLTGYNDLATTHPKLVKQLHTTKNPNLDPQNITYGSDTKAWWVCDKGHEWEARIANRSTGKNCISCSSTTTSKVEELISIFLKQYNFSIKYSDRTVLQPMELDFYIPEKNIAIEYNGVYWHSEKVRKDNKYHYNKWLACKEKGIQLIQIWEDDWNRNPELIKTTLAHKLNVSQQEKIYGRKTTVQKISKIEAEIFLNNNHIQGFASGSHYLGLKTLPKQKNEPETLRGILVLKKEKDNTLNIIRYATSANVIGGFTKLLKYAEKTYSPDSFITFSDHCISDGGLYQNNGFTADKELKPDYMYVVKGERKHKFGYRLKRFKNDPELLWEEGLTESQLAKLNNLPRIWDAGKTRWIKTI